VAEEELVEGPVLETARGRWPAQNTARSVDKVEMGILDMFRLETKQPVSPQRSPTLIIHSYRLRSSFEVISHDASVPA
jgi:hypothetical protein